MKSQSNLLKTGVFLATAAFLARHRRGSADAHPYEIHQHCCRAFG